MTSRTLRNACRARLGLPPLPARSLALRATLPLGVLALVGTVGFYATGDVRLALLAIGAIALCGVSLAAVMCEPTRGRIEP